MSLAFTLCSGDGGGSQGWGCYPCSGSFSGLRGANRALSVGYAKKCNSVLLVSPDDEEEEEEDQEEEQNSGPRVYIGDVPSITVIPMLVPQVLPEEQEGEEGMSDSDSEGPILYKDDEEDEEEDESHNSKALTLQLCFFFCSAELVPGCIELGIKEQFTQSFKAAGSWFHDAPRVLSPTFSKAMAAKPVCSSDKMLPLQLQVANPPPAAGGLCCPTPSAGGALHRDAGCCCSKLGAVLSRESKP